VGCGVCGSKGSRQVSEHQPPVGVGGSKDLLLTCGGLIRKTSKHQSINKRVSGTVSYRF
jgi:hypothetical protein